MKIKCRIPGLQKDSMPDVDLPHLEESVRTAVDAAKGYSRIDPWTSRLKRAFGDLVRQFSRKRPGLDNIKDALTKDILRQFDAIPEFSKTIALNQIREITRNLTPNRYEAFTRILWMRDVVRDYEEGRTDLPFQYESIEKVQADLDALTQLANNDPSLAQALNARNAFVQGLTRRLVESDLLHPDVLKDPRYYHRQVVAKVREKQNAGPGVSGRDVRERKKGFQKGRNAPDQNDFNTQYHEAEWEWVAQAQAQLLRHETLERLDDHLNIQKQLRVQAKTVNEQRVRAIYAEKGIDGGLGDPYQPFAKRIAIANGYLARMAEKGTLDTVGGKWDGLVEDLREAYLWHKANKKDLGLGNFQFNDPRWFSFLADLAQNADEQGGKISALSIFKTLAERRQFTEQFLASNGTKAFTWADLMPEGYTKWSPDAGPRGFQVKTITDSVLERVLAEEIKLDPSMIATAIAMRPRTQWAIPENVAPELDNVQGRSIADENVVERAMRKALAFWKQWVLINPLRVLRYNLNNASGDLDITLAYDPALSKGTVAAARDLRAHTKGTSTGQAKTDIDEALRYGVIASGLTAQEIPDVSEDVHFKVLMGSDVNAIQKLWSKSKEWTTWRENILRIAAYRYFKAKIKAGKRPVGASRRDEMDALYREMAQHKISPNEVAAKLGRELVGDYGNVSNGGQWIRSHLIPFYSWLEVNAPRYLHLMRNTTVDEKATQAQIAKVAGAKVAKKAVGLGFKASAMMMVVNAFNYAMWDDDEVDDFNRSRRQLHLIVGKNEDTGQFITLRWQGAFSDMLEWIGASDLKADIADLESGDATLTDKAADALKAPLNRYVMGLTPYLKTAAEVAYGSRFYPTVFEEGASLKLAPRPIRRRDIEALRTFSADWLYLQLWQGLYEAGGTSTPAPPNYDGGEMVASLLTYRTRLGEAAYWTTRRRVWKFMEDELGKEAPSIKPTARSNSLYYFRLAIKIGDEEKAQEWLQKYYELGGTKSGIAASIDRQNPLSGLSAAQKRGFLAGLNDQQRKSLDAAMQWYNETYKD